MTLLLNCESLEKAFGSQRLFQGLSFSLFSQDRLALIGPNGAGKSTLLKILAEEEECDRGAVTKRKNLKIGYVSQHNEFSEQTLKAYLFAALEGEIEEYEKNHLVERWLTKLGFQEENAIASRLSGGWKKRLALAKALINQPDILLLDEPTNHLDLEGVLWLEKFLLREVKTFILVSHDRYFLQNVANRIIEIDPLYPQGLFAVEGSFENFLEKKELFIQGQIEQERSLASQARREIDWLRRSPKARTTKAQSRIDNANEIIEQHRDVKRRNREKRAEISFEASERETRKLLVAKNVSYSIEGRVLFNHLDLTLTHGSRLGMIGSNGSGKTTLLKLLSGEIIPEQGTIKRADDLKIVHFDQHRMQLPQNITLKEALSPHGDYVIFQNQPVHVNGWCKRFLFSPDSLQMPIGQLSGGERARIAIAHLMLQPADLLLLDEPTNDLDMATLQTLEETLTDFQGAVVLITHDRYMLSKMGNLFLALGTPEGAKFYADYAKWEEDFQRKEEKPQEKKVKVEEPKNTPQKRSYKEKKEYEEIERVLPLEEKKLQSLKLQLEEEGVVNDPHKLNEVCKEIAFTEEKINQLYERIIELT